MAIGRRRPRKLESDQCGLAEDGSATSAGDTGYRIHVRFARGRRQSPCPLRARFGHASSYRREVAATASGQCDLRTVFPKVISGLRRPIAIQAAISLNMNLPE